MSNGRAKGSRGELEVAHILMQWWAKLEPAARFIRTPLSGGWQHDTKASAHFNACGDIMTTASFFPFCVEVKWRERWFVDNFFDGKCGPPWAWWRQTVEAAKKQVRCVPMMWMRRNRMPRSSTSFPWLVLVPLEYARSQKLAVPDVQWDETLLRQNGVDFADVLPAVYVYDRFLQMSPVRMRLQGAA